MAGPPFGALFYEAELSIAEHEGYVNKNRQVVLTTICELDYTEVMHEIQRKIIDLAQTEDLDELGLRGIGRRIGVDHPQKVKFHLEQLQRKGFFEIDEIGRLRPVKAQTTSGLINVPILGRANCGEPLAVADQQLLGFLKLTGSVLDAHERESTFAVKATGNSMNRAFVGGTAINDGDYVLVDSEDIDAEGGKYVVATVDGGAVIKKFVRAPDGLIMLVSESSEEHPPIVIDERDSAGLKINGTVRRVISMLSAV
jgi:SOS-response transcriptional repressor LexA